MRVRGKKTSSNPNGGISKASEFSLVSEDGRFGLSLNQRGCLELSPVRGSTIKKVGS